MGQLCGPGVLCDLDKVTGDRQLGDEATRKVDQLALELRILKDENYRIREEQLRLEKELKQENCCTMVLNPAFLPADREAQGRGRSNQDRRSGHEDQQLLYMKEVIRSLQVDLPNLALKLPKRNIDVLKGNFGCFSGSMVVCRQALQEFPQLSPESRLRFLRALASRYEALHREQEELRNKVRRLARG
eukprot:g9033.t1